MPIPDYDGETFVAFADISGFKEMMRRDNQAVVALDQFYTSGYQILRDTPEVHGLFISDCAVLFVNSHVAPQEQLNHLLRVVETLNRKVLASNIMLATSIAYGRFAFHQRLEFAGIEKNPVYGNAYVAALLDNESGQPRIQPGQCRIVKKHLPDIEMQGLPRLREEGRHLLFYWMVPTEGGIEAFAEKYNDAYQQKYRGMMEALKDAANQAVVGTSLRAAPHR